MKFILLLLCVAPLINARSLQGRESSSCIADYLKSLGLIEENLGSDDPLNPLCKAIAEVTKTMVMAAIKDQVESDKDMKKDSACIMNSLQKSDMGNSLLTLYVYESAEGIADDAQLEKRKQIEANVTKSTFNAFIVCQAETKFGKIFDDMLTEESSEEEEDLKEDYCIRKHIRENGLIDVDNLSLAPNPKNIDTSDVDCVVIFQKGLKDAEDELVKSLMEEESGEDEEKKVKLDENHISCLVEVVRQNSFIDKVLQYDYIKEMNPTNAQKSEMRANFIKVMTKLAESSSTCFL